MRIVLSLAIAVLLTGCAGTMDALNPKPIQPKIGDTFDAVNKMSNEAGTGDLVDITAGALSVLSQKRSYTGTPMDVYGSRQNDPAYDPYKFYRAFQRNFIDHTILQPQTAKSDVFVFRQDKLVLISQGGDSFPNEMKTLAEDGKRRDFYGADFDLANKIHADYGAWASKQDMANLHALKVNDVNELNAAEAELKNYSELYRSTDAGDLFRYLVDRAVSSSKHISIAQAAQMRKVEEDKAAKQREQEAQQREKEAALLRAKVKTIDARDLAELRAKKIKFGTLFYCSDAGGSGLAENLISYAASENNMLFARALYDQPWRRFCGQEFVPFTDLAALHSGGTLYATRNGKEYYLVKTGANMTLGVMGPANVYKPKRYIPEMVCNGKEAWLADSLDDNRAGWRTGAEALSAGERYAERLNNSGDMAGCRVNTVYVATGGSRFVPINK
ncbi:MAG TPA: hypothetical protein VIU46_05395 [Gallionellaceae bacterium]